MDAADKGERCSKLCQRVKAHAEKCRPTLEWAVGQADDVLKVEPASSTVASIRSLFDTAAGVFKDVRSTVEQYGGMSFAKRLITKTEELETLTAELERRLSKAVDDLQRGLPAVTNAPVPSPSGSIALQASLTTVDKLNACVLKVDQQFSTFHSVHSLASSVVDCTASVTNTVLSILPGVDTVAEHPGQVLEEAESNAVVHVVVNSVADFGQNLLMALPIGKQICIIAEGLVRICTSYIKRTDWIMQFENCISEFAKVLADADNAMVYQKGKCSHPI
jgi:hypothetical protein